jgi:hypothetical protein
MWSVVALAATVNAMAMAVCLTALSFSPVSPANLPPGLGSAFGAKAITGTLIFDIVLLVMVPMVMAVFSPMRRLATDYLGDQGPSSRRDAA